MTAKGWQGGLSHMFFLMTPDGVGSCFDGFSGECSTNVFCAYHSFFVDSSSEDVIYANEPDLGPPGGCTDSPTGLPERLGRRHHGQHDQPRAQRGDHRSAHDTRPWRGSRRRDEIGDLCAYGFGTKLGTPASTPTTR